MTEIIQKNVRANQMEWNWKGAKLNERINRKFLVTPNFEGKFGIMVSAD
jgi:hypothetical protein